MAYQMTTHRKLSEISGLDQRSRTRFHKLPREKRVRVIEVIDVVTAENLKAAIEAVKKGN